MLAFLIANESLDTSDLNDVEHWVHVLAAFISNCLIIAGADGDVKEVVTVCNAAVALL